MMIVMENKIEILSSLVFDNLEKNGNKSQTKFHGKFEEIDIKAFLAYNFSLYSSSYLDRLMFSLKSYWDFFLLSDWIALIKESSGHELGIRYCLSFLYKYLGVDSLNLFRSLGDIDAGLKDETLTYFENHRNSLAVFERIYAFELQKFDLDELSFLPIKERLMKDGVGEAKKIYPDRINLG
jgi:hypothetical protein